MLYILLCVLISIVIIQLLPGRFYVVVGWVILILGFLVLKALYPELFYIAFGAAIIVGLGVRVLIDAKNKKIKESRIKKIDDLRGEIDGKKDFEVDEFYEGVLSAVREEGYASYFVVSGALDRLKAQGVTSNTIRRMVDLLEARGVIASGSSYFEKREVVDGGGVGLSFKE